MFVAVQARDNSEKQEASAVLFPSWSPAGKKKNRAGLCLYFVQLETVKLNVLLLPVLVRYLACHKGPKGHKAACVIGSALHPHTPARAECPRPPASLEESTPQPGTAPLHCKMPPCPLHKKKKKCLFLVLRTWSLYTSNPNTASPGKEGTSQGTWSRWLCPRAVGMAAAWHRHTAAPARKKGWEKPPGCTRVRSPRWSRRWCPCRPSGTRTGTRSSGWRLPT